ncbi:MAG: hypothetical protein QN120_06955 [Armatimonadota bacterium]|nr:hypothetical protein [Armatimonadota bacterium]
MACARSRLGTAVPDIRGDLPQLSVGGDAPPDDLVSVVCRDAVRGGRERDPEEWDDRPAPGALLLRAQVEPGCPVRLRGTQGLGFALQMVGPECERGVETGQAIIVVDLALDFEQAQFSEHQGLHVPSFDERGLLGRPGRTSCGDGAQDRDAGNQEGDCTGGLRAEGGETRRRVSSS